MDNENKNEHQDKEKKRVIDGYGIIVDGSKTLNDMSYILQQGRLLILPSY